VARDVYIGDSLFDTWHVTGDALVAGACNLVMRVFFNRTYVRAVRRTRSMAFQADHVGWLD
jgi:hypothetical protein